MADKKLNDEAEIKFAEVKTNLLLLFEGKYNIENLEKISLAAFIHVKRSQSILEQCYST